MSVTFIKRYGGLAWKPIEVTALMRGLKTTGYWSLFHQDELALKGNHTRAAVARILGGLDNEFSHDVRA